MFVEGLTTGCTPVPGDPCITHITYHMGLRVKLRVTKIAIKYKILENYFPQTVG